jgi:hypothetical protein
MNKDDNIEISFTEVSKQISPKSSKYFLTSNQIEQSNSEVIHYHELTNLEAKFIFNFPFRLSTINDWVKYKYL